MDATVEDGLRLSVYFGERDRANGRLLADELMELYARHAVHASVLLRGTEGFGIKHRLASERLLTLSEDLPLVAVAMDTPARIERLLDGVQSVSGHGVITLERARLVRHPHETAETGPGPDEVKLTVYVGRQERVEGRPAYLALVDALHRNGVAGASALLGVDGTVHGQRRRARFFARNAEVPLMIQSVGTGASVALALAEIAALWQASARAPAITLERVRVCKRDGELLAQPHAPATSDSAGLAHWQKLVVYTSERTRHGADRLHTGLVRRLRREGAAGVSVLRGQWGYHGAHPPHGEAFWSLGRHVPILTVLLDTPANMRRWFAIVDAVTAETGLVTSELVPALRAAGPGIEHGGLALAPPHAAPPG